MFAVYQQSRSGYLTFINKELQILYTKHRVKHGMEILYCSDVSCTTKRAVWEFLPLFCFNLSKYNH